MNPASALAGPSRGHPLAGLRGRLQRHSTLLAMLAVAALTVLPYLRALAFGFFNDDPTGNFAWMERLSWLRLFTNAEGYGYYRPVTFAVYKLLLGILGAQSALGLHALVLALHAANASLLWRLVAQVSRRPALAWCATLAFIAFPLNYEAVVYVAALFHPLLAFWTLLALVLYLQMRRTGRPRSRWVIQAVVLVALFTHENALAIPVLLLAVDLMLDPPRRLREVVSRPVLQFWIAPALFVVWWFSVPKAAAQGPGSLAGVLRNTLPFIQALAYPLLPLARLRPDAAGPLAGLAVVTLALTYLAARRLHLAGWWLVLVIWVAVAAGPSVLFLNWDYLHGSPRLYYLPSLAAAQLWALPVLALADLARVQARAGMRAGLRCAAAAAAVVIVLPPLPFIGCEVDMYAQASALVRLLGDTGKTAPAGRELVFVNLPFFFTSYPAKPAGCPATYPYVTTGAIAIPAYAHLGDFIRFNGGPDRPARGAVVKEYDGDWPPRYGDALPLSGVRATLGSAQVYVFDSRKWALQDLSAIWRPDAPAGGAPLATFGGDLALIAAGAQHTENRLIVNLDWRILTTRRSPVTGFVHLYDPAGKLVAQQDAPPGRNAAATDYAPFVLWQPGDVIHDVKILALPDRLPTGTYTVAAGLYDPNTGERLPARRDNENTLPDNIWPVAQITLPSRATAR